MSLLATAVERSPLLAAEANSGSPIERVRLADGTSLVVKTISPTWDWVMRATHDQGRAATLWTSGVLARVPPLVDHAYVGVEQEGDAWAIVMRDVAAALIPDGATVRRAESLRVLEAFSVMHAEFAGAAIEGLCSLDDRYGVFSPARALEDPARACPFSVLHERGWSLFADLVRSEVASPVLQLVDDPAPLVAELGRYPSTLIHGDLKVANLGLLPDRVIALDWGSLTGVAPASVEFAWYLGYNSAQLSEVGELTGDWRRIAGDGHDERALQLALLGVVVQLGWWKALFAGVDPARAGDLDFWIRVAGEALETWCP